MAGLLADIFSYGDTLKRKTKGLLDDPRGTLEQFVGQLGDSINQNSALSDQSGLGVGKKPFVSVLADSRPSIGYEQNPVAVTPQQMQYARDTLAEQGSQNAMAAATVWHGSPHKFDKFDSSKIGTGEGAQAYGHGLYLAESPAVAGQYQKMLSGTKAADGSALNWDNPAEVAAMRLHQFGGDKDKAIQWITTGKVDGHNAAAGLPNPAISAANKRAHDFGQQVISEIKAGPKVAVDSGSIYKVDLPDEHIAKMLDYDNPVPEAVRKPLSKAALDQFGSGLTDTSGEKLYKEMIFNFKQAGHQNPTQAATDWLTQQGIPGMRYLDGGSRGAGQGSSNFVVFPGNEGLLNILERNGQSIGGLLK